METITVVGAGGIGCAIGYALSAAGRNVIYIEADVAKITWGRHNGVRVNNRPARPAVFEAFTDWQPSSSGWVLLCTKCYDNAAVLAKLPSTVSLLPIQNGFDRQLDSFGHQYEGIASFVARCIPGTTSVTITRPGELHLSYRRGFGISSKGIAALADDLRRAGLFRVIVPDVPIEPFKHTKLMYNAAISPLAAAAGIDNGELLADTLARRLFFGLLRENYAILAAAEIELGTIGPFHPQTVNRILHRRWLARLMAWVFEPSLRGTYCSMAGEIEKGRTEIDNYTGHLLQLASNRGVPCPLNQAVYDMVTRLQRERRRPHRDHLAVLENLS